MAVTISEALTAILDDIKVVADNKNPIFNSEGQSIGRGENLKDHAEAAKFLREALTLGEAEAGIGSVSASGSSTTNAIARFADATGRIIKNSPLIIGDLGELSGLQHTDYNLITGVVHKEGRTFYNSSNHALELKIDIIGITQSLGQEFWNRVKNNTGVTIPNGSAVYINGGDSPSGLSTIALAQADDEATANVLGYATHDIPADTEGIVTEIGFLNDLNTSSFSEGDPIFLSATTAGGITATKPTIVVPMGFISIVSATVGRINLTINRINTDSPIFAQLSSSVDQIPGTTNPTTITYNTQDEIAGITHSVSVNPGDITVDVAGTYFIMVQPQIGKNSGASKLDMTIFFQVDTGGGFTDLTNSAARLTIKDPDRQDVLIVGFTKKFSKGDKINAMQRVESTTGGLGLKVTAAEVGPPTVPATPSVIFSMFRVGGF